MFSKDRRRNLFKSCTSLTRNRNSISAGRHFAKLLKLRDYCIQLLELFLFGRICDTYPHSTVRNDLSFLYHCFFSDNIRKKLISVHAFAPVVLPYLFLGFVLFQFPNTSALPTILSKKCDAMLAYFVRFQFPIASAVPTILNKNAMQCCLHN